MTTSSTAPSPSTETTALALSWSTQKSKEDVLTLAILRTVEKAFKGTGAELLPELDNVHRLKRDFVLRLDDIISFSIEGKYEDYSVSWFPEVAQLVCRGNSKEVVPGWIYKTTADFLLYLSPVSGVMTLIPRLRALEIQERLLEDVLLSTRAFDHPCLLNAALNPAEKLPNGKTSDIAMARAGIGLGLLRSNILTAYSLLYGNEGLLHIDMRPTLQVLKDHFTGVKQRAELPELTADLTQWAQTKVLQEDVPEGTTFTPLSDLPALLSNSDLLYAISARTSALAPTAYKFFINCVGARMCTGQTWLSQYVPGTYQIKDGPQMEVAEPLPSSTKMSRDGQDVSRARAQYRTPSQLKELVQVGLPKEERMVQRREYLENARSLAAAVPA